MLDPSEYEFWRNLDRYLVRLQDDDKNSRRSVLKTIYTQVQCLDSFHPPYELDNDPQAQGECTLAASTNIVETQIGLFVRPMLRCTSDPSEKCREIAFDVLTLIFDRICVERGIEFLPSVLPPLVDKFGQPEIYETCEEVRLAAYKFIQKLANHLEKHVEACCSDLISICINGITDTFLEIRIITCAIISTIAKSGKQNFFFSSERLVGPISVSINHPQNRVRSAVISCIGNVVKEGHARCLDPLLHPLTSRVFDLSSVVRRAFIEVIGDWMLTYNERYSNFHKFIPLLFTGFYDDVADIIELTKSLWLKIGDQYLAENIEEHKEMADFLPVPGLGTSRPTIGCKILTALNIGKLLPAIRNEIGDWQFPTRLKTLQLLHCLIYNCEEKVTMHLSEIIECLSKACTDENPLMNEYVEKSAVLIGLYVPLQVTWPLLKDEIEQISNHFRHFGALKVTVGVLSKANPFMIENFMREIAILISQKAICQSRDEKIQTCIVDICGSLIKSGPQQAAKEIHGEAFYVLLAVSSLTQSPLIKKKAAVFLRQLQFALEIRTVEEFMGIYCGPVLRDMKLHCTEWTNDCADKLIFELIWTHGGVTLQKNWQTIIDIMITNLAPYKDPKVRLDFFTKLSIQLSEHHDLSRTSKDKLEKFLAVVIQEVLDPNMAWKAGETAAALRTGALGCVHAILEGGYVNPILVVQIVPALIANIIPMLEESLEVTRLLVCETCKLVAVSADGKLPAEIMHKIYPAMLKRLDDSSPSVRILATQAIKAVFTNIPSWYETQFKAHIEYVYSVMVLHLDDDEIKAYVLEALNEIGKLNPQCLVQECEKIRGKQRSPVLCDELIGKFQNMCVATEKANECQDGQDKYR